MSHPYEYSNNHMSGLLNKLLRDSIEVFSLGILLALLDTLLHSEPSRWLENPVSTGRSLTWMIMFYGTASLIIACLVRRGRWIVGLLVFGFILAQGGLRFYRADIGSDLLSPTTLFPLAGIFTFAIVLSWICSRLYQRIPHRFGVASIVLTLSVFVALLSFIISIPPPDSLEPWPSLDKLSTIPSKKPNVLLITLDTVRPDHLGAYHYEKIRTPNIDSIAEEGVIFLRGISQAPITPVSHASILTGFYPPKHTLRNFEHDNQPSETTPLLSEILQQTGYLTGAIVAAPTLSPLFGLNRGFDVYHYLPSSDTYIFAEFGRSLLPTAMQLLGIIKDRTAYRGGVEQTQDALHWLDKYKDVPFFLWVHYFDVHDPYFPNPETRYPDRHPGRSQENLSGRDFNYDCEIIGVDMQVGRIVDRLKKYNLFDNTITAVISDHGEGLGDHNYIGHTRRIYDEQLRLVFFIRYPDQLPKGKIISAQVRSIDLMPTILELLEITVSDDLDGQSLLPLIGSNGDSMNRIAFSETFAPSEKELHLVAVSDGKYKLIQSLGGKSWLFDLEEDPKELRNLIDERPEEKIRLGAEISNYISMENSTSGVEENHTELNQEMRDKLKSLGYIND